MNFFTLKCTNLCELDSQNVIHNAQNERFHRNIDFKQNIIATRASDEIQTRQSRSIKICTQQYISSFQANFLHEHITTLQDKIKNLMESSKIIDLNQEFFKLRLELNQNTHQDLSLKQFMASEFCQIEKNQVQQFHYDLAYESKLRDFLSFIYEKYNNQLSGQLITLANFIWQKYVQVVKEKKNLEKLKQWAQKSVQTQANQCLKLMRSINDFLNQIENQQDRQNLIYELKQFIKFYFTTIVLVVEQYFQNPYFSTNNSNEIDRSGKRSFCSDDFYSQDQGPQPQSQNSLQSIYGKKKIKFC